MRDEEHQKLVELVRQHVDQLGEHFEHVQIFAGQHEGEKGTYAIKLGSGNFYARFGQVYEWLMDQNERTKEIVRRQENEEIQ